ncbi:unnamed protein product [Rhizoctonia solani]|uniref:Ricin B lectin domain-containing protein n=1 Tax=Rhizoctonia solani TaxID=456999 RepID=A0A8H2W8I5_9AGAM|nr:unnamed protein product [Rhizoctonia solani]
MKPGTYRIVNLKSNTAIIENHLGTVGWRKLEGSKNQQWFVQISGEGYRFKNVESGGYLAVSITGDWGNRVYCGGYPTTWTLAPNPEYKGLGIYGIMVGDTDLILDLLDWGNKSDGTSIHASSRVLHTGSTQHMAWKFEHLSDETGEESPTGAQIKEALSRSEKTIEAQAAEIQFLRTLILDIRQDVARITSQTEKLQPLAASENNLQQRPNNMT